jgi:hypothetical protein
MSLQKQLVHLNMSGGLQKKDDQFLVIPSKLAVADNVEFDDANTVITRGGQRTRTLANATTVLESVGAAQSIFSNNGSAVIQSKNGMHRLTEAGVSQVWNAGGADPRNFPRAALSTQRVDSILQKTVTTYPLYGMSMDMAVIGNATCVAWESRDKSTGLMSIKYRFATLDTGVTLVTGTLNTIGTKIRVKPRVLVSGTKFVLMYGIFTAGAATYEIRRIVFNSDGTVSSAEAVVVTSSAGAGIVESADGFAVMFDAAVSLDGASMGLVYRDIDAARTLRFREISQTTFLTTAVVANVAPSAIPTTLTAHVSVSGGTYKLHAFMSLGTTTLRVINMNLVSAALSAETTVGTGAAGSITFRSTAIQTTSGGLITVAWDSTPATGEQSSLHLSSFDTAYGTLTECSSASTWFIAGTLYQYDSRLYVPMCFAATASVAESTFFVVDVTSLARNLGTANTGPLNAVARIDYGESPFTKDKLGTGNIRVQSSCNISNGVTFPYPKFETDLVFAGTQNDTAICVSLAKLDYTSQLAHAEANGLTFLAGACPLIYDGQYVVEEGFHHAPVIASGAMGAAGTYGPFLVGTVTVCFTYGWQDARGNWHESAPSAQVQITPTAPLPYYTPLLVLPPTLKTNAVVRIYRTKATSTDTSLYLSMDTAGNFVSSDTDLASSEQLYTAGNVLPNTPAPACRHVSLFQKRLVLSGCGDGSRIYYSKPIDTGFGVEFSSGDPTHQGIAPPSAGRVVGTCELDDNLVVLCEDAIGVIAGSGPSPTGLQGEYSTFGTRSANLGADWNSPKSILRAPEGVWFRSPYGIRFFARQGQIQVNDDGKQMGADVDSLVSGNIVAIAGGAKQQARFYQSSGTCLVYDYQWQQWTRFTGMSSVDAVYADGRYYHLSNVGSTPLLRYTDNTYLFDDTDAGTTGQGFDGYVETPWLAFAGLQGFQRIYRLLIAGQVAGGAGAGQNINGLVGYNYGDLSAMWTAASAQPVPTGSNNLIQMQHHFSQQKCESLKLGISFRAVSASSGRLRLTDLTLQVGAKAGYFKMPSSARY